MLTKQFANVLYFNPINNKMGGAEPKPRYEKIKFRKFEKSSKTIQRIKDAGLQNEIDDFIQVENNYRIKKIGKFLLKVHSFLFHFQSDTEPHQLSTKPRCYKWMAMPTLLTTRPSPSALPSKRSRTSSTTRSMPTES